MVQNLDLFMYVNSKFVHIEIHIRTQMEQLYFDVITQKCKLEQQTLRNALLIARQNPHEFAYILMQAPGYMAITAGEGIHVIECFPVEVKIRHSGFWIISEGRERRRTTICTRRYWEMIWNTYLNYEPWSALTTPRSRTRTSVVCSKGPHTSRSATWRDDCWTSEGPWSARLIG